MPTQAEQATKRRDTQRALQQQRARSKRGAAQPAPATARPATTSAVRQSERRAMAETAPTTAPPSRKLTDEERQILIAEIRLSFHYQRTMWEAIRSGIALGAEEVQDQRLAALETPPEPDRTVEMFLLIVTLILGSPAVLSIAATIQGAVAAHLKSQLKLQTRAYRNLIAIETRGARAALEEAALKAASRQAKATRRQRAAAERGSSGRVRRAQTAIERADAAQKELDAALAGLREKRRMIARPAAFSDTVAALKGIRSKAATDYIVAGIKVAFEGARGTAAGQASPKAPGGEGAVSPGITVRAEVEKQALELIQESYFDQELSELLVHGPETTVADAADIYEDIEVRGPVDVGPIVDRYQLVASAVIWGQLLQLGDLRTRRLLEQDARTRVSMQFSHDPIAPGSRQGGKLFSLPEAHRKYLTARFGDAAEAWARSSPQDVLLPGPRFPGTPEPRELESYLQAGKPETLKPGMLRSIQEALRTAAGPEDLRSDLVVQWLALLASSAPQLLRLS